MDTGKAPEEKKCFVMMPISDADGYDKGHFTRVYEHLIKPAIENAGFKPIRADDTSKANFIVVDILQQILDCDIAICDLSARNPNVFYELGVRQAFNKKTVLICDDRTVKPFDTSGIRTLLYSASLRVDEVLKNIPNLTKCITETANPENNDVNSLVQLLSIETPANIPDKVQLSQDSSVILNAIKDLNKRMDFITGNDKKRANIFTDDSQVILPNGAIVKLGDNIFEDSPSHPFLGILFGETKELILLKNENEIIAIPKNDGKGKLLTELPF
nr:hypothetical protein [uncultured Bacteroides sp.]